MVSLCRLSHTIKHYNIEDLFMIPEEVLAADLAAATASLRESQRVIDRIVAKGILHRNAGDRHKSRLAQAIKTLK